MAHQVRPIQILRFAQAGYNMNGSLPASLVQDSKNSTAPDQEPEETLVKDGRSGQSPRQQVEQKVIDILNDSSLLVSQIQKQLKPGVH